MKFIGRNDEVVILQRVTSKPRAAFMVIRGRRRIGKSRLAAEFSKGEDFYNFAGIPPNESTTAQSQRDEFASQLAGHGFPRVQAQDWNDLFSLLGTKVQKGRCIILLDEISWMGSEDPDFLGKLKNAWDYNFKNNPKLVLILCGSASSWIEKNILSDTGYLGRISQTLTLQELPLEDCQQFWGKKAKHISAMEKLKVLAVTGGIPRYLEEIDPNISAEDNIRNLCFTQGALLVNEFDNIFSNTFLRHSDYYLKIVSLLANGSKNYTEIAQTLGLASGRLSEYLEELILAGFIKRDFTWRLKDGQDAKASHYRLSDNYCRFYLHYIAKNRSKIERNSFDFTSLAKLPQWDTVIGLQFENLVLNNRAFIWQALGLKPEDIVSENPFFQRKNSKQPGCQIDYMIQTKHNTLYICEIKFSRNKINGSVIEELEEKMARLVRPKGVSCRAVLIHVNGVTEHLMEEDYFSAIIDFSQAL